MHRHRVAVLGCGPRGRDHARAFLQAPDRFELVGLCDRDGERLARVSEELGIDRTFGDAGEMLEETRPEIFCFCTPPRVRLTLVELGVRAGVRLIAFEKPMALSLREAHAIRDRCNAAGVKFVVSHQHKYGPHWRAVRDLAASGALGKIRTIHATSLGWLLQYGTHLVDYAIFLNGGSRVRRLTGFVRGRGRLEDSHPSPDYALAHFEFDNGVRGILECGEFAPNYPGDNNPFWLDAGATVIGEEGWAQVIVGNGWRAVTRDGTGLRTGGGRFDVAHDQPLYVRDIADWLDDESRVHPCNGEVSVHGFEAVMGIVLSALDRREVHLPLEEEPDLIERMRRELP